MAVVTAQKSVLNTGTLLAENTAAFGKRTVSVVVVNQGASSIWIGPSGVSTATGLEVKPTASIGVTLGPTESLYGVVAAAAMTMHVLTTNALRS